MITEVLLILPLYLSDIVLHMVSISTFNKDNGDVGEILNNNEFFGDIVDTPKKGIE